MSIYEEKKKLNFNQVEEYGAMDYYLTLLKFVQQFIDHNYPMSINNMRSVVNNAKNHQLEERNFAYSCMSQSLKELVEKRMNDNIIFMQKLNNGEDIRPESVEEYNQDLLTSKQYILEEFWNAKNGIIRNVSEENKNHKR